CRTLRPARRSHAVRDRAEKHRRGHSRRTRSEGRSSDMSFQWGGLTDGPGRLHEPPARATRHRSSISVIRYEKFDISSHDDGSTLVSTVLTERFSGAIEGIGVADHIRLLHPDGTGISTGIERIEGTVDGRAGSFILTAHGRNLSAAKVNGTWT